MGKSGFELFLFSVPPEFSIAGNPNLLALDFFSRFFTFFLPPLDSETSAPDPSFFSTRASCPCEPSIVTSGETSESPFPWASVMF